MAWTLEYGARAVKALGRLDRPVRRQILAELDGRVVPSDHPCGFSKGLPSGLADLWRYRLGDHRGVCRIEHHRLVVLVLRVRHRGAVYDHGL